MHSPGFLHELKGPIVGAGDVQVEANGTSLSLIVVLVGNTWAVLAGRPGVRDGVQEGLFKKVFINNGPVPGLLTRAETATGVSGALWAFRLLNIQNHRMFPCCSSCTKEPIVRSGWRIFVWLLSPEVHKKQIDLLYQRTVIAISDFLFRIQSSRYCLWIIKPYYCEDSQIRVSTFMVL